MNINFQGSYVPSNNFTASVAGEIRIPDIFGVKMPPAHFEFLVRNMPVSDPEDAIKALKDAIVLAVTKKINENGDVVDSGITEIRFDDSSQVRQSSPVNDEGNPIEWNN